MPIYFFTAVAIMIVGIIGAIVNSVAFTERAFTNNERSVKAFFRTHVIFGGMYALGALASLVTGIIWLVQTLMA